MELNINKDSIVLNIQQEFNKLYPYLKIEFSAEVKKQNGYSKTEKLAPTASFKTLQAMDKNVLININSNRTVAEIEKDFKDSTGMIIQLYRKSGNVWIETSLTDDWSLGRQNDAGEVLSYNNLKKNVT